VSSTAVHPHATAHGQGHGHGHGAPAAPPVASGVTTRAVVFEEAGRLGFRDVALRVAGDDEVVVATAYSSISSGTERLLFGGKLPGFPQLRFPLVPGYEAAGVVVETGSAVTDVRVGDEVFVGGSMCYADVAAAFGGQSGRLIKKAAQVVPLRGIPLAHAPLLALAATSLHGVARLGDVREHHVVVLGMGAIGQFAARFLAARGARVTCADVRPERLREASQFETIDLSATPLDAAVQGVDAIVEATGLSEQIAVCARALRPGGTIALLSYYDELRTPYVDLFVKEATLLVAREWAHPDLLAARDALASGEIPVGTLADHVVPVERYESAYRTAFEDPSVLKVILQWA
jgi:3-hydroxyethyl bacteriochlorophyllide a dehydrogenase